MADLAPHEVIVRPGVLDDEARRAYAAAWSPKCDTSGGLGTMESELADAMLFDVVAGGQIVGRYALKQIARARGIEVCIVAAVGAMSGVRLAETVLPDVAQRCAGADALSVHTRRPGLIKKLQAQGWTVDSVVMRKKYERQ